jgi:hypothetical protein
MLVLLKLSQLESFWFPSFNLRDALSVLRYFS